MVQSVDPSPFDDLPPDQAREREMARRSHNPTLGLWLVVGLILLVGFGVYVVSALFWP